MIRSLLLLSLLVATQVSAATVYRTVDKDGNVQYSDRPAGGDTQELNIRTRRPAPSSAQAQVAAATPSATGTAQEAAPEGPTEEQLAEEAARKAERRAENCKIARERLERYAISHRLYRPLPNGEREYLSDAEIDEARAKAESDVKEWCQ